MLFLKKKIFFLKSSEHLLPDWKMGNGITEEKKGQKQKKNNFRVSLKLSLMLNLF